MSLLVATQKVKKKGIGSISTSSQAFISNVDYVNVLKHNFLSISQLCDKGYSVSFNELECNVVDKTTNSEIFTRKKSENVYIINLGEVKNNACLVAVNNNQSIL